VVGSYDCEWDLHDGRISILEVDGGLHVDVLGWRADIKRARSLTTGRRAVVRCTSFELRHAAEDVDGDLIALNVPRGL